jgi:uncharacterized protein (DUF305 family)
MNGKMTLSGMLGPAAAVALLSCTAMNIHAQTAHSHHGPSASPPPFIARSAKPFSELMNDGMKRAGVNGVTEHDFVTMMIPHHQGAIDMAKALLVYTNDPELKNLAQGIITEQQSEIRLMQAWLQRYRGQQTGK